MTTLKPQKTIQLKDDIGLTTGQCNKTNLLTFIGVVITFATTIIMYGGI